MNETEAIAAIRAGQVETGLQALIEARLDPEGGLLSWTGGTHGVALWARPSRVAGRFFGAEYIVHRWAIDDTDGQPIGTGVIFYSGGYYDSRQLANDDFKERYERDARRKQEV